MSQRPRRVQEAYSYCVENMRLQGSDLLFGIPVVMDTNDESLQPGMKVELTYGGQSIAVMEIDSKWIPNKPLEALKCYGTSSLEHPGVLMIATERGKYYIGGKVNILFHLRRFPCMAAGPTPRPQALADSCECLQVHGLELPKRVFPCATPAEVRAMLPPHHDVVAFQCRNPIHRAHYELFTRALHADNVKDEAVCLVHPTCGPTQDDDIPGIVRYHTYEVLKKEVDNPKIKWSYLPYSMHMAGPREAIQHMLIRKNYGCTHFIIGRDMAGSKSSVTGEDFYGPYDAQDLAKANAAELGMQTVPSLNVVYTEEEGYVTADVAKDKNLTQKKLSGTKFRKMLRSGDDIPEWFAFKSVVGVLREHTAAQ
jgi:sulfate adenylyltransferase